MVNHSVCDTPPYKPCTLEDLMGRQRCMQQSFLLDSQVKVTALEMVAVGLEKVAAVVSEWASVVMVGPEMEVWGRVVMAMAMVDQADNGQHTIPGSTSDHPPLETNHRNQGQCLWGDIQCIHCMWLDPLPGISHRSVSRLQYIFAIKERVEKEVGSVEEVDHTPTNKSRWKHHLKW